MNAATLPTNGVAGVASLLIPVKALVVTASSVEGLAWLLNINVTSQVAVPGLPAGSPSVSCNAVGVCVVITGMGHANSAASLAAVVWSRLFDLTRAYVLVTGIAGVDPMRATIGGATWARYAVDFGLQWELDARDAPSNWSGGYLGVNTKSPDEVPTPLYGTEMYRLNETLLQAALSLSRNATLVDSADAQRYRALYAAGSPGALPPAVVQCDVASGDTWWSGTLLGARARAWVALLTGGAGVYCAAEQETTAVSARATSADAPGRVASCVRRDN